LSAHPFEVFVKLRSSSWMVLSCWMVGCGVSDRMVDVEPGTDAGADDARRDVHAGTGGNATGGSGGGTAGNGTGGAAGSSTGGGGAGNATGGAAGSATGGAAGSATGGAGGAAGSAPGGAAGTGGRGGAAGNGTGGTLPDAAPPNDARPDTSTPDSGCPVNACGGCGVLAGAPNAACGNGGCGKYVCSADKSSVTCSDPSVGGCCIGGTTYASGSVKPDNTCMGCTPGTSTTAWSARTTCGNANAGCSCSAGTPKETNCSDGTSNDGDPQADCADSDCNNLVCLSQTNDGRTPNDDYWVRYDEQGNPFQQNGSQILELYNGSSSGPHAFQHSYVWLMFGSLPQSSTAVISKAVLRFYYTSTSADLGTPNVSSTVSIKDARAIGSGDPKICTLTLPVVPTTPTAITCDVTTIVKDWFASSVPVGQRGFRLASDNFGDQSINISATEMSSANAPRVLLDYTTKCAGNVCPNL
jgi:hypothetical protein